ncbi:DUF4381 domain-containing protein [Pseudoalteromonas haloplanktis]|uniref:DUF4381 domain-containing protein n=1 Tax=Pseudoalteromonas haloplanktis TaxID=228 RepID=A0ABU1BG05_PSEHA|nr:DUF4381 domain-containing protein [Pseudoalteromonas haloplanktis]MDQ9093182.1 DUF4381 domain-containing protein [Pseudoalteromonas haloplanktis]
MNEAELEGLELYQVMDLMADLTPSEEISMMPQTWGWAVLAGIIIVAALLFWYWQRRRALKNQHRRFAISSIESLDDNCSALDISTILKRCALHDFNRQEVAALTGQQWQTFLNHHAPEGVEFDDFNQLHYHGEPFNVAALKSNAIKWLSGYRVSL